MRLSNTRRTGKLVIIALNYVQLNFSRSLSQEGSIILDTHSGLATFG